MKNCKVLLSKNAYSDLSKLQNKTSKRIVAKLEFFEKSANPLNFAKT
jgi:mRNA-degrading endonuclease RelE of RelBE toxin-antitoxin system